MKDIWKLINNNKVIIALLIVIGLLSNGLYKAKQGKIPTLPKIVKEKRQPAPKPECTPQEAKIVLEGTSLLSDAYFVVLNLNNFELVSETIEHGKVWKKYRQFGRIQTYYTTATPLEKKYIKVEKKK